MTRNGVTWTYTYNADGLRTSRSNGTTTYNYVYNGDKLSQMTIVDVATNAKETVDLAYDASGLPMTLTYTAAGATQSTTYYYITNIQGDVVGLTDTQGDLLVGYTYEAYGKGYSSSYNDTQSALLVRINPLAYRSYVFDSGTGLYYLQSRYYDPTLGRFLNADVQLNMSLGILGSNAFSYCLNNPVNMIDNGGNKPGDLFDTMDEAAIDAAKYIGPISFENGWEYATAFYQVRTTGYKAIYTQKTFTTRGKTHTITYVDYIETTVTKYTYVTETTDKSATYVYIPRVPFLRKRVGAFHTHPMGSWVGKTRFSDADREWAKSEDIPLYVFGPNGVLLKYDPSIKGSIHVADGLPQSSKQPWLDYV